MAETAADEDLEIMVSARALEDDEETMASIRNCSRRGSSLRPASVRFQSYPANSTAGFYLVPSGTSTTRWILTKLNIGPLW